MTDKEKIVQAVELIGNWGGIQGDHHRAWTLDQVLRVLLGDEYPQWVKDYEDGADGPRTYEWDTGIAP